MYGGDAFNPYIRKLSRKEMYMPSYEKRNNKSWRLTVEAGMKSNGKRDRKYKTIRIDDESLLKTTKKLKSYLDSEWLKFKMEVEAGEYLKPEKMSFSSFVEEWKSKYAKTNLSPTTYAIYSVHIKNRILPSFGHMQIDQIKSMHIVNFFNDLQKDGHRLDGKKKALDSATVGYIHKVIKNIFSRAAEWRIVTHNIMLDIPKPKPTDTHKKMMKLKENPQWYSENEAHQVIDALYKETRKWRLLILGSMIGGLRRGEINGIEWAHANFDTGEMKIDNTIPLTENGKPIEKGPKNYSSYRNVSMPKWYMEELFKYRHEWNKEKQVLGDKWQGADREYIFHNGTGAPYYYQHPSKWWKKFCQRHSIRYIKFHGLRHSSGTLLLEDENEANVDSILKAIQERLGHSRLSTTSDIYVHVTKKMKERTAFKFDKFARDEKKETIKLVPQRKIK